MTLKRRAVEMTKKTPRAGARGKRKPHNARTTGYISFNDLLAQIAAEPRTAFVGDEPVVMSRRERMLRLMVDRALQKNVRDVTTLLRMMAKKPALAATFREETVIVFSGMLAGV
jgi:hypothetical protein